MEQNHCERDGGWVVDSGERLLFLVTAGSGFIYPLALAYIPIAAMLQFT